MLRVVIDTNILISAFLFGGKPRHVIELIIEGEVSSVTSAVLLRELEGVLLEKFRVPYPIASNLVREWEGVNQLVEPKASLSVIHEDPSDNRVLECAVSGRVDAIISGDRHLLQLLKFRGIPILSAEQFLTDWRY